MPLKAVLNKHTVDFCAVESGVAVAGVGLNLFLYGRTSEHEPKASGEHSEPRGISNEAVVRGGIDDA